MAGLATVATFREDDADPRHGTANGYRNLKCRCERCRKANNLYRRKMLTELPGLEQTRRARQRAAYLPRDIDETVRVRLARERDALALRHAAEMDELIGRQFREIRGQS